MAKNLPVDAPLPHPIGPYRFLRLLGKGAMGAVYEVSHEHLGVHRALKLFDTEGRNVESLRKRFLAEGKLLARLDHPRLVRVHDLAFDEADGTPYFTMDLVVGPDGRPRNLADAQEAGAAQEDRLATWYADMRDALAAALPPLMHDIRDEEHYEETMTLCNLLNGEMRRRNGLGNTALNRFRMRQLITSRIESGEWDIRNMASIVKDSPLADLRPQAIKAYSDHWSLTTTLASLLVVAIAVAAVVTVPLLRKAALFCLLCYPLPLIPTHLIVRSKVADPQFRSSFNFGVRLVLAIVYTIVIFIVMTTGGIVRGLAALAVVIVGARLTGPAIGLLRDMLWSARHWMMRLFRSKEMQKLDTAYKALVEQAGKLL